MKLSLQPSAQISVAGLLCRGLLVLCSIALIPLSKQSLPHLTADTRTPTPPTGSNALFSLTTGVRNTADGYLALYFDTTGRYNTASGAQAFTTTPLE